MEIVLIVYGIIVVSGGFVAYSKNDYFSRGFFICLLTGVFGLAVLVKSKPSLAKDDNEYDKHYWPGNSHYALLATAITFLIVLFTY
ncbi:MAG: hypothetical protein D8M58_01695 [Calditrichaeota bacterium]|nr:MAG: hypothetical protein DWQ03_05385 [Calditrichota bacterium]MBL1204081.1 hypothetical protein [Calditrichota bacterium]NOG43911.1 hypothetical protein [Calditrichota bacterium]